MNHPSQADGPKFVPWDVASLPHLPAEAAVNPEPITIDDRPDDRTLTRGATAYDRRRALESALTALDTEGTDAAVDAVVEAHDAIAVPVTVGDLTVIHRGRTPWQRVSYLAAVLGGLSLMAGVLGITPGQTVAAQAATRQAAAMGPGLNLRAAPHHTVSGVLHAGFWLVKDTAGHTHYEVCISYNHPAPDGTAAAFRAALPAPSPEAGARLKTAANLTTGTDATSGAVLWFAAARILVDDPAARSKDAAALRADLPVYEREAGAVVVARAKDLAAAARVHAPYAVTVDGTGAVPGQTGTAKVSVRGSNGQPAAGRPVSWTVTGATITSAGRATGTAGTASVTFRSTTLGQTVTAAVTTPSAATVWTNAAAVTPGKQIVIGGGATDTTRASAVFELCPVEASHRTVCPCKKTGTRDVTVTFDAAALPGWYQGYVTVDGVEAGHTDLDANGAGDVTAHVQTGQDVEVGYRIYPTAARTGAALYSDTLDAWTQR